MTDLCRPRRFAIAAGQLFDLRRIDANRAPPALAMHGACCRGPKSSWRLRKGAGLAAPTCLVSPSRQSRDLRPNQRAGPDPGPTSPIVPEAHTGNGASIAVHGDAAPPRIGMQPEAGR